MNPNSKNPMVRMFAEREKESKRALDNLIKSEKAAKEMLNIMQNWKP